MNNRDLLRGRDQDIRNEWFKNHVAEMSSLGEICVLTWFEPGTINCKIWYVLRENHGVLMVYGDLGEAVYRWYGGTSFQAIASYNLQYFHSKTCASELGRVTDNYEWNEKEAEEGIFEHFKENKDCKGYKKFKDSYASKMLHNKQEFIACLHAGEIDIFGQDAWEWIYDIGDVIPIRCQAHLIGIKMATKWRHG